MVMLLCMTAFTASADETINILINGKIVTFTDSSGYPYIDDNGRTMVPLRVTMEAAGAAVGWDQGKQTAIVITEHDRIEVPVGAGYLYNNNTKVDNDTAAVVKDGRTYLPIRAVLESADFTVEWDGNTQTVNAYTFTLNDSFVPYSTNSILTLLEEVLAGNVVYVNGSYYSTPDYVKLMVNTEVHYSGDDLNQAIYPQSGHNDIVETDKPEFQAVAKEWVTVGDLERAGITFSSFPLKGFYGGLMGSCLYSMPSIPDDFTERPADGIYDGISIKVEGGVILFYQEDLLECNILKDTITEIKAIQS